MTRPTYDILWGAIIYTTTTDGQPRHNSIGRSLHCPPQHERAQKPRNDRTTILTKTNGNSPLKEANREKANYQYIQ